MAVNGTINKTTFTDQTNIQNGTSILIKAVHVNELRTAVNKLEGYAVNVNNCGCQACQNTCTCQSDKCQSCQKCQDSCTCQSCQSDKCQTCQKCQNTCTQCTCQSDKCQSCESCQDSCTCQSCQSTRNCNCSNCSDCSYDCDCGDDYSSGGEW